MRVLILVLPVLACAGAVLPAAGQTEEPASAPPYLDSNRPTEQRIADLIARMTLEEKVSQLTHDSKAIERLGIPAYNWWNECLHGVARAGKATVFPQAIGLAATFDEGLIRRVASATANEGRAKYHAAARDNRRGQYRGLTFWTPNINIFRDPRWGRGQETYGEDPCLTARMGTAFVRGLQGDHPRYLKAAACAKHFAVHSGPEAQRHSFDAVVSPKDLHETYLPAFKALVEAGVEGVMCAYNRTNGQPCCGGRPLLVDLLRDEWGFDGYVVSDCWALTDLHKHHRVTDSAVESAALAINNGVNVNCGVVYRELLDAVKQGLVTEAAIDESLAILLRTRFRLGMFDPDALNPYAATPPEVINCPQRRALAREAAAKSIVLLKNRDHVLPLRKDLNKLYVVGPNAASVQVLLGNYHGVSDDLVTVLEGIVARVSPTCTVRYAQGCLLDRPNAGRGFSTWDARNADAIVAVMGISGLLEGEEGESIASAHQGDRPDLTLPANQLAYLQALRAGNEKPIVVVLTGGGPIIAPEVHELADAVLFAWYPGEQGGHAVADVLFGDVSPAGRLPITFPRSLDQLPPYDDYAMAGRTYRYMTAEPMYPFGFGLGYSAFKYADLHVTPEQVAGNADATVTVRVTNAGQVAGDEVVQLYVTQLDAPADAPRWSLKGFRRVHLAPGQSRTVTFALGPDTLTTITSEGRAVRAPGRYRITVAGAAPLPRSIALGAAEPVSATLELQ